MVYAYFLDIIISENDNAAPKHRVKLALSSVIGRKQYNREKNENWNITENIDKGIIIFKS